jgi:uroporphyrinogen-III synthase
MKIIVTRPRLEADAWVKQLRALHLDAVALPLIHIGAPLENDEVRRAWTALHQYRAVMFVSSNAVRYFYSVNTRIASEYIDYSAIKNIVNLDNSASNPRRPILPRMWATGPGTREALLAQAVPSDLIDSPSVDAVQFDSETLWLIVKHQVKQGDKVLIVRGRSSNANGVESVKMNGRPWLADQLTAAGVLVDVVVSYQRNIPVFDVAELAFMHQASTDQSIWLLSSSEAVANLRTISNLNVSQNKAITTHPRIAQAARDAGFGVVYESRPLLADVAACVAASIESMP